VRCIIIDHKHEPEYPALNRAAFLIERASVPRYHPSPYCAEMGQLLAGIAARLQENQPNSQSEGQDGQNHPAH